MRSTLLALGLICCAVGCRTSASSGNSAHPTAPALAAGDNLLPAARGEFTSRPAGESEVAVIQSEAGAGKGDIASAVRLIEAKPHVIAATAFQVDDLPPALPEPVPSGDAATSPSITLEELQSIAAASNPTLALAAARVDAARGRWLQAGLYPNPMIGYVGDEIGMAGRAGMQGMQLSQTIVRGGKLGLDRAAASQEVAQAQQQFEAQRLRVLNDVRTQFYQLLVAQRALELSDELAELGERGLKTAELLFRPPVQEVSRVDVLQAQIELSTARVTAEQARNRHVAVWRRLAATIGAPQMEPSRAVGELDAVGTELLWDDVLARVLTASPELAAARADVVRARWAVDRARAEPIPNLNVQASVQHDNDGGDDVANVQVMLPIPIHDKNQGAIRSALAELRMAQADVARLELDLQTRLAAAFERYANARRQVDRYSREILPDARTSLDLVTKAYRNGEIGYLTLLEAQRTISRTNLAYLAALEQLWESTAAIEGLLLTQSLQTQVLR
jgi:cobalt-zinc-cadmium efflux system outer membrane protein